MAENGFLANNEHIDFPFIAGADRAMGASTFPKEGVVDAGFMLGLDSGFILGTHSVYLTKVVVASPNLTLHFESDAPNTTLYEWKFTMANTISFGCTLQCNASLKAGGSPTLDCGWAFLAVGDVTGSGKLFSLANGTYTLDTPMNVEPALIQSLVSTFVRTLNVGNIERQCYSNCVAAPALPEVVYINETGLQGEVRFKEGYNAQLIVDKSANVLEIKANKGGGDGEPCVDLIVNADGDVLEDDGTVCGTCDGFIKSINGQEITSGNLKLLSGSGVVITTDEPGHSLTVAITAEVCDA